MDLTNVVETVGADVSEPLIRAIGSGLDVPARKIKANGRTVLVAHLNGREMNLVVQARMRCGDDVLFEWCHRADDGTESEPSRVLVFERRYVFSVPAIRGPGARLRLLIQTATHGEFCMRIESPVNETHGVAVLVGPSRREMLNLLRHMRKSKTPDVSSRWRQVIKNASDVCYVAW